VNGARLRWVALLIVGMLVTGIKWDHLFSAWIVNQNGIRFLGFSPIDKASLERAAPKYTRAWLILGAGAFREKEYDQSMLWFDSVLEQPESYPLANWWLGQIFLAQDERDKAVEHFQAADAGPRFQSDCVRKAEGALIDRYPKIEDALRACKLALEITESDNIISLWMAKLFLAQGDRKQSGEFFLRAAYVEEDPYTQQILIGHGSQLLNDWEQAVAAYRKAMVLNPNKASPYLEVGIILYSYFGEKVTAHRTLEQAVKINPNDASINYWLSRVENDLGDYDKAYYHSFRAVELDPCNVSYTILWGDISLALSDYQTARKAYQKTLTLDPGNLYAQNKISHIDQLMDQEP
jgi:tetratricopeptide (TPR) repeat protein